MPGPAHCTVYRTGGAGVAWRETAGEIVVLDLDASVYFGLNPTAAQLWKRMTTGATHAQLVAVAAQCGASAPQADADVVDFLAALDGQGLLRRD